MKSQPIVYTWGGRAMIPLRRYQKACDRQFVVGEEYTLQVSEPRSQASHNAYFAELASGFDNLPEGMAVRWPTVEHLRKWLLIETGFSEEREFRMDTEEKARALALFVRDTDGFARISVYGRKVIVRRAKSQSHQAMGKEEFQASKKACLELLEYLIGVPLGSLRREAKRA